MFKWVSVTFEERSVWLRFAELSDRPISLVCRALVTARNKRRTRQSTLPRRKNSEFTAFHGGKDVCSHPSTRGWRLPSERILSCQLYVRRIYTPPAPLAGRGGALKLVRGDAAFLIMSLYLPPSPERNNSVRRFGSGRVGFWTRHRRASYPCFCWMPAVTYPRIHGQNRSVSTAAKKNPHSVAIVWENSCGTTICKRRKHTFQWGATLFGPLTNTQIDFACLPATVHVHSC